MRERAWVWQEAGQHCSAPASNRSQYVAKIEKVLTPVKAKEDRIFSSSFAAAKYLERHGFRGKQVMGIGAPGMLDQLRSVAGVTTIGPELTGKSFDPDADQSLIKEEAGSGRTRAVVVGFDGDYNYCKAAMAGSILRYNADCLFLATNRDMTYPTSSGILLPGGGSVVKSVEAASGREVQVVAGKPSPVLMDLIAGEIGLTKTADGKWPALMVGDRLDTDIAFGNAVGIPTLLVMSGVTSEAALASALQAAEAADPHAPWTVEQLFDPATIPAHLKVPTFIADDVGVLHTALQ